MIPVLLAFSSFKFLFFSVFLSFAFSKFNKKEGFSSSFFLVLMVQTVE